MNRKTFIKTSISLMGASIVPIPWTQEEYPVSILLGKGNPKLHSPEIQLLNAVGNAFQRMQAAAKKDGILLEIVSAYRSFERQKASGIENLNSIKKKDFPQSKISIKLLNTQRFQGLRDTIGEQMLILLMVQK